MSKGVIYVMTTVLGGLLKIGKTGTAQFENRMKLLENNGYRNITGLKRAFAIEVEDYDEKEVLLHTIFGKSQVADTELFAVNKDTVIQLLSAFEGTVVYPKTETKEEIFDKATVSLQNSGIPNGLYTIEHIDKTSGKNIKVKATAKFDNGSWTLLKGSVLSFNKTKYSNKKVDEVRIQMKIKDGILQQDFFLGECSPSTAGSVVLNISVNGWHNWKNADGKTIDIYRK